jgi:hypothetical protein
MRALSVPRTTSTEPVTFGLFLFRTPRDDGDEADAE